MNKVLITAAASPAQSAVQRRLDELRMMQENIVNAGHRPDTAVSAILALEHQRQRIIDADRVLARVLSKAEDEASRIMGDLIH
jgi:hypothetical protein